jgi:hypothetical protein
MTQFKIILYKFSLEHGNLNFFKEVMIYINKVYTKYDYNAIITILKNPKGHKGHNSKYSWFRNYYDQTSDWFYYYNL